MYGYEYEFDFLLCLRLLKFLHMQSPESAKRVIEIYKEVDTEEIGIVMEEILWDIFSDAEFDTDEFNELTIVYFSHRYEPILFGNTLIDMVLYCQRDLRRLEARMEKEKVIEFEVARKEAA